MESHNHISPFRYVGLVLYCALMIVVTHWPNLEEEFPLVTRAPSHTDKLVHVGLYIGWTVVWWFVLVRPGRPIKVRTLATLLALGMFWAALDELTQAWVGRWPNWWDFALDLAGIALALSVLWACHMGRSRLSSDNVSADGGDPPSRSPAGPFRK